MLDDHEHLDDDTISILGMSCRFPGARNLDEYRDLLRAGKSVFSPFTKQDAIENGVPDSQIEKRSLSAQALPWMAYSTMIPPLPT